MHGRQIPCTIKYLVRAQRNQTQSIGNGPALGRKAKYIFKAVVASLPALGAHPKSEPDGVCVSQLAQAAVGPSSGFSEQREEVVLPSLHTVLRPGPERDSFWALIAIGPSVPLCIQPS